MKTYFEYLPAIIALWLIWTGLMTYIRLLSKGNNDETELQKKTYLLLLIPVFGQLLALYKIFKLALN